jgi:hypothetical protein
VITIFLVYSVEVDRKKEMISGQKGPLKEFAILLV